MTGQHKGPPATYRGLPPWEIGTPQPAPRTGPTTSMACARFLRPGGRLIVLCYSDRHTTEPIPPHRLSFGELESCFTRGWSVESIQALTCASTLHAGGVAAWPATSTRL